MATAKTAAHPFYWTYAPTDTLELLFTPTSSHAVAVLGQIRSLGLNEVVGAFDSDNLFAGYHFSLKDQTGDLSIGIDFIFPTNASVTLSARLLDKNGTEKSPLVAPITAKAGETPHMTLSLYTA